MGRWEVRVAVGCVVAVVTVARSLELTLTLISLGRHQTIAKHSLFTTESSRLLCDLLFLELMSIGSRLKSEWWAAAGRLWGF